MDGFKKVRSRASLFARANWESAVVWHFERKNLPKSRSFFLVFWNLPSKRAKNNIAPAKHGFSTFYSMESKAYGACACFDGFLLCVLNIALIFLSEFSAMKSISIALARGDYPPSLWREPLPSAADIALCKHNFVDRREKGTRMIATSNRGCTRDRIRVVYRYNDCNMNSTDIFSNNKEDLLP